MSAVTDIVGHFLNALAKTIKIYIETCKDMSLEVFYCKEVADKK